MSDDAWEPIENRRMWGVFDANGYSPDALALFRSEQDANEWLAWDATRGDDQQICCEPCVCVVDGVTGRMWNSIEDAPPEVQS